MQPSQPPTIPGPSSTSQYDFIMNSGGQPGAAHKATKGGPGLKQRIIIVVGGAFLLVVLVAIVMSIISNSGKAGSESLLNIAAEQTEIVRITDLGTQKARTSQTRNFIATTSVTTKANRYNTLALLKTKKYKYEPSRLNSKKDSTVDTALSAAEKNNTYDDVFQKKLTSILTQHLTDLKNAYNATSVKSEKDLLSAQYNGLALILKDQQK